MNFAHLYRWIDKDTNSVMKIEVDSIEKDHLQQIINDFAEEKFDVSKMKIGDAKRIFYKSFFDCYAIVYDGTKESLNEIVLPFHKIN